MNKKLLKQKLEEARRAAEKVEKMLPLIERVTVADNSASSPACAEQVRQAAQKAIDLFERRGEPVPPHALAAMKNPWSKPSDQGFAQLGPGAARMSDVDNREVVRCESCLFVQFRTGEDRCGRCYASFDRETFRSERTDEVAATLPFASRIREIREQMHISEDELGRRLGKSSTYVSQVETGAIVPSWHQLEEVANVLNVETSELFQAQATETVSEYVFPDVSAELAQFVNRFSESARRQLWREWQYDPSLRKL
jgi:transcriptional regulator with XRE-family HTH domain